MTKLIAAVRLALAALIAAVFSLFYAMVAGSTPYARLMAALAFAVLIVAGLAASGRSGQTKLLAIAASSTCLFLVALAWSVPILVLIDTRLLLGMALQILFIACLVVLLFPPLVSRG